MNHYQKLLISLFIPLTILIIVLDYFFPAQTFVDIIKFATMTALLLASLQLKKRFKAQFLLLLAVMFAVSGDFSLVLLDRYLNFYLPLGMACFTISYGFLTAVFIKSNPLQPWVSTLAAVPVLSLIIPVAYLAYNQITPHILSFGIIFMTVLSCMTWSAIKTPFGSYYSCRPAKLMAAAGLLILICDSSVILSLFGPASPHYITLLLKTITWAAWIPAWTLIAVLIAEDNLLA